MRRHLATEIAPSEITKPEVFFNRRQWLAAALAAGAGSAVPAFADSLALKYPRNARYSTDERLNSLEDISSYNNFYEFGTDKTTPKDNAHTLRTRPWSVTVDGEAEVRGRFTLEDLLKPHPLEERVYRLRCVERWSMVIPWLGFPLGALLTRFKPTSKAKFVEMTTLHDPRQMPGQRFPVLDWPYTEGLRIDEAMHPLAFMVIGVYGRQLPNQNGAPLRLAVPWKYGFKSVKSIVRIRFTERQPRTAWNAASPGEYGFYSNVNPKVDHPRWSQATERRLGRSIFDQQQPTLPFNGYAAEVASLYKGMDLRRYF